MNNKYDTLVLSGGGVSGILILGALHHIYETELSLLNDIKYYSGTSAGGFISFLLIIGYTPMDIFLYICSKIENIDISNLTIDSILQKHGFINKNNIITHLKILTLEKTGKEDITFKELYDEYKKELVLCTYNVTKNKTIYFSTAQTPNMSCIEAMRLSSAIPIVFSKQYYEDELYIDGALTNFFPINNVYSPYTSNILNDNNNIHILGIYIKNECPVNDKTLLDYMLYIIQLMNDIGQKYTIPSNSFVVKLNNNTNIQSFNFNTKTTQKIQLFIHGLNIAKEILHLKKD